MWELKHAAKANYRLAPFEVRTLNGAIASLALQRPDNGAQRRTDTSPSAPHRRAVLPPVF